MYSIVKYKFNACKFFSKCNPASCGNRLTGMARSLGSELAIQTIKGFLLTLEYEVSIYMKKSQ